MRPKLRVTEIYNLLGPEIGLNWCRLFRLLRRCTQVFCNPDCLATLRLQLTINPALLGRSWQREIRVEEIAYQWFNRSRIQSLPFFRFPQSALLKTTGCGLLVVWSPTCRSNGATNPPFRKSKLQVQVNCSCPVTHCQSLSVVVCRSFLLRLRLGRVW